MDIVGAGRLLHTAHQQQRQNENDQEPGTLKYAPVQCPEAQTGLAHWLGQI